MYYPETVYARSKDGNVAYQVVGDGPQDLVFIPSWLNNIDAMWEEPSLAHFLRRLATFGRILCFDKRGAGASDTVSLAELPTLEQWSDDVRTVMEAAGSKRAALLGLGAGGQMAMLFAATYPEQTSALILVNSSARRLRDVDYPCGLPENRLPRASSGSRSYGEPAVISISSHRAWLRMWISVAGMPASSDSLWARARHVPFLLPGGKAICVTSCPRSECPHSSCTELATSSSGSTTAAISLSTSAVRDSWRCPETITSSTPVKPRPCLLRSSSS